MASEPLQLADQLANLFAAFPQVEAVALGGSRASGAGTCDPEADIDLYVYTRGEIPLEDRRAIVERSGGAAQTSLNLTYWGAGDEWINLPTGIEVDIVYFDAAWMSDQITRVIERHQASLGYSTCFWFTIRHSAPFFDRNDWFARLQEQCQAEYPGTLRQNIIALNYPVLRSIIPAYIHQIEKAVRRGDRISVNHRLTGLLASYFDILFAFNRQIHPGEKRLVEYAASHCQCLPVNMEADLESVLLLAGTDMVKLPDQITVLLDHLDQMLENMGFVIKS